MLTKDQAVTEREFHYGNCKRLVGPRGGITTVQTSVRRIGATTTWKTRPNEWSVPVQLGFYNSGKFRITHWHASEWHVPSECPLNTKLYQLTFHDGSHSLIACEHHMNDVTNARYSSDWRVTDYLQRPALCDYCELHVQ